MNILILTPIHPIAIQSLLIQLGKYIKDEVGISSVAVAAMLAEETGNFLSDNNEQPRLNYIEHFVVYSVAMRKDKHWLKDRFLNRKINLVIGNWDKNTKVQFDHILAFEEEPWKLADDEYLKETNRLLEQIPEKVRPQLFDWYTKEEASIEMPSMHHLLLMLKTLGVTKDVD